MTTLPLNAVLSLAGYAEMSLEFLPPCQVEPMAERVNAAYEACGFPELCLGHEEIVRRKNVAGFRRARLKKTGSMETTREMVERAIETSRQRAKRHD